MASSELKITDKSSFLIAIVGLMIALEPIKDDLKDINIDFIFVNCSILVLIYVTFALLLFSIYFYALDYVRYGFKILDGLSLFKYLQTIADSFYFIAILSPIIYSVAWGIIRIYKLFPNFNINNPQLEALFFLLSSIVLSIFSILAAWKQNKESNQAKEEDLDESALNSMNEARQLIDKKSWNLSIIEAYHSLELSISKKLIELGIDAKKIPFFRSIDILLKHGVLTIDEANKLNDIRKLRNKAVHASIAFSEEEVSEVIENINDILPKLKTPTRSGSLFEKEIFKALSGEGGLFPKHHLFRQKSDQGYDIKAEGPNYDNYLIEIKFTRNHMVVYKVLDALKKISSGNNVRYIIVVPKTERPIKLNGDDAKVLYYDFEKHEFENRDEIYNWIYGAEADDK